MNYGRVGVRFWSASHETSEGKTLSFGPWALTMKKRLPEGEDIHDHIAEITIDQPQESLQGFSFGR